MNKSLEMALQDFVYFFFKKQSSFKVQRPLMIAYVCLFTHLPYYGKLAEHRRHFQAYLLLS